MALTRAGAERTLLIDGPRHLPYKTVMPVTMFMLLLQGIANFVRDYYELKGEKI